jgi:uncharacterized protein
MRRRNWRRWLLVGVAVVLVASGTAYAFMDPMDSDDDRGASRTDTTTPQATAVPASDPTCSGPLDPGDPLRLWIGGDSLAGSLGPSLGELTGKSGVVQPIVDSRVSSGLLSPDFFDWPKNGAEDMSTYDPDVTVFIIGANDAKSLPKDADQNPQGRARYTAVVEEMLEVLAEGRTVYWIGAPIMSDTAYSERVKSVNSVYQEVAAKHPEARYVDAFTIFSGPDGRFASTLPRDDGRVVRVRARDGIHLTPDGGDMLARTVLQQLEAQCRITEQAVAGVSKPIVEVKGSSSVPGSRRR